MSNSTKVLTPSEPIPSARSVPLSWARAGGRLLVDRLATRLVTGGGIIIIASILAILFVIVAEVVPLFLPPTATLVGQVTLQGAKHPLAIGVDEYQEVAYVVTADGVAFARTRDGSPLPASPLVSLGQAKITATSPLGRGVIALGTSDGRILPIEVRFAVTFQGGKRIITPDLQRSSPLRLDSDGRPLRLVAIANASNGPIAVALLESGEFVVHSIEERKALIGPSTREEARRTLTFPAGVRPTALALDGRGEDLFIGTAKGTVVRVDIRNPLDPKVGLETPVASAAGTAVTALGFVLGDRTLIIGDHSGGVSTWRWIQEGERRPQLLRIHSYRKHPGPVVAFDMSRRGKGFMTVDGSGTVLVHHATSGETLLALQGDTKNARGIVYAPKADGLLAVDADGRLLHWRVSNPHPETTLGSLFGKVWYEGYSQPEFVWQSTGATDDFESKFSLIPLIYGTLKGTFYALLLAVPVALLAALYASQFMHPVLKGYVKPTVEIMAALPSVVLGFLGGLWLAPQVERVVPGIFLACLVTPACILVAVFGWRLTPIALRQHLKAGSEVGALIPVVILAGLLSFYLGGAIERWLFHGDYRSWLFSVLGLTYDQRNSLVVGIAMGFAVIPIIFTIAEDSLSNVPQHLVAGSLALGATRWQTALRVVLPTASPGIFSAIMIGFGRAVGETMIVLMATGNTPIMDWSIFNGFRALSANIAVELPEAPQGGTLFRILFVAALLLFIMTFIVNTAAEVVRLRLRKRYRYL